MHKRLRYLTSSIVLHNCVISALHYVEHMCIAARLLLVTQLFLFALFYEHNLLCVEGSHSLPHGYTKDKTSASRSTLFIVSTIRHSWGTNFRDLMIKSVNKSQRVLQLLNSPKLVTAINSVLKVYSSQLFLGSDST